jgi:hypothetical protein
MSEQTRKPTLRVYPIDVPDQPTRYIECASLAEAVVHVFAPTKARPLSGGEVAALIRDKGQDVIERIRVAP